MLGSAFRPAPPAVALRSDLALISAHFGFGSDWDPIATAAPAVEVVFAVRIIKRFANSLPLLG